MGLLHFAYLVVQEFSFDKTFLLKLYTVWGFLVWWWLAPQPLFLKIGLDFLENNPNCVFRTASLDKC